ncbi:MAG: hypothetical protein FGM14_06900 [Flavobacteriales bacterium]|nr:hypothetical protein [Flavobacteriales bacterium]
MYVISPIKEFYFKNQEFNQSEIYFVNSSEQFSALNFMVLATELKLLIFKISVPSADGLQKFQLQKGVKIVRYEL